jgi:SAM-dependent methyltransferase
MRYDPLNPETYMRLQERERRLIKVITSVGLTPVREKRVLEIGCGGGHGLLELIKLGFEPWNLAGCELLEERAEVARSRLPQACTVITGDAATVPLGDSYDVVMQSTVFSSLLDDGYQEKLSERMWGATAPGGGVLWYDFVYDNPWNPDVRGVPLRRVRELFPQATITADRVSLAPPLARRVVRVHPQLYGVFNTLPLLRTHLLCWISKPS